MRRQITLIALFSLIFQIYFSTSNEFPTKNSTIDPGNQQNKCETASIDEFPSLFFTDDQRRRGGILVHIALMLYSFAAIEIVCDDYFASALEKISYNLNLTPDVAGATFMALATSASEFFTSIVGVFFVKSDIALGTIVGSAVFNVLFVVALCALISSSVCQLETYPIVRDAGFYCVAIVVLFIVIRDQRVYWYEALALILLYFLYVAILKLNERLYRLFSSDRKKQMQRRSTDHHSEHIQSLNDHFELEQNLPTRPRSVSESVMMNSMVGFEYMKRRSTYKPCTKRLKDTLGHHQIVANATEIFDPFKLPNKRHKQLKWFLMYPVRLLMHITIPDCRKEVFHNYYMLTFVMSTIWVAGLAYFLVWLVVIIGYTLNIRENIMGLTILAIGSSIEEIFSAIVMTRRGHPEMAIAGSLGSNVFDILMGLGIPWFFRNLMRFTYQPTPMETDPSLVGAAFSSGSLINENSAMNNLPFYVEVHSKGLIYSIIVLFITLIVFLLTFFINRCRLTKAYGVFLIFVWLSVMTIICLFELNIFGAVHPEPCQT